LFLDEPVDQDADPVVTRIDRNQRPDQCVPLLVTPVNERTQLA
jgi:hypothetical protein